MKKTYKIIELLESIGEQRDITDLREATWLNRFNYEHPMYVHLVHNEEPTGPYFKATLTNAGRRYIEELQHNEIFRVPQEIHIF